MLVLTSKKTGVMYFQQVVQKIPGRNPSMSLICSEILSTPVCSIRMNRRWKAGTQSSGEFMISNALSERQDVGRISGRQRTVKEEGAALVLLDTCYFSVGRIFPPLDQRCLPSALTWTPRLVVPTP